MPNREADQTKKRETSVATNWFFNGHKHKLTAEVSYFNYDKTGDVPADQWRFIVDHPTPKLIVLCENLANLKRPWIARTHDIELWYVGGNNTAILEYISPGKLEVPLLYSCDWDQHGLDIYKRIHGIFAGKHKEIRILGFLLQISNRFFVPLPKLCKGHQ